ncbi:MAG: SMI1/KNR4 family protein [Saccharospirillaceae bacterium]|nr:SMI1/KNR4 family protein [Pseudomonadales bacterium]NRB77421.1 SMI1/KNR4 family protein [Saccharospirillaceae bacterium]
MEISELQDRLGFTIPNSYIETINNSKISKGFDVKTLCILNLILRDNDNEGWTENRFFLNGDGCGNFYFINVDSDRSKVFLWVHDPLGIEDPNYTVLEYLSSAIQEMPFSGSLCTEFDISRTEKIDESVLNPISLDEWKTIIGKIPNLIYTGFKEGKNPFSGDIYKIKILGIAVFNDGDIESEFLLSNGHISTESTCDKTKKICQLIKNEV